MSALMEAQSGRSALALHDWAARLAAMKDGPVQADRAELVEMAAEAFDKALREGCLPIGLRPAALSTFASLGMVRQVEALWALHRHDRFTADSFFTALAQVRSDADRIRLLEDHRTWAADFERVAMEAPIARPPPSRDGPIRLGFVSSDLRNHVVGLFALPVMRHRDSRFELFTYSGWKGPSDGVRDFIASASTYRTLDPANPQASAQQIADDRLDMLIELGGPTRPDLPPLLAYRMASIQASWLGYPHSTGFKAIDYLIVDEHVEPDSHFRSEQALRLPFGWLSYYRPMFADEQVIDPVLPEDRNGFVTFGTMNAPIKYSADLLRTWARIVVATPGSRFRFVRGEGRSPLFRRGVGEIFAEEGVVGHRLIFDTLSGFHMPGYNQIDVALDTFPLTGGTTTFDTLWMGVPLVSLVGPAFFERLSHGILAGIGEDGLSVTTVADYERLAGELARDRARRLRLRGELRGQILAGPIGQAAPFAATFYATIAELVARTRQSTGVRNQTLD